MKSISIVYKKSKKDLSEGKYDNRTARKSID